MYIKIVKIPLKNNYQLGCELIKGFLGKKGFNE